MTACAAGITIEAARSIHKNRPSAVPGALHGVAGLQQLRLETERLILRNYRLTDFEDHYKLCADPNVMRYLLGGKPMSRLEAWRHMAFLVGHWELLGYGYFAAEEKATGRFVGRIGYTNPEGWPGFEVGWTIAPEYQGRGLATEGGKFLLEYAFKEMDRGHVISVIHPDNKASISVAEKLGESLEGEAEIAGVRMLIYGIDRPR
ncbi:MAG: GNAT family N-acetyltransferase [Gemmatimonadaceae bacterium]